MSRVIELGSYVSIAYAGMVLAEQDREVEKWLGAAPDPVLGLHRGDELWHWLNMSKRLVNMHARMITKLAPESGLVVIDNLREQTWQRWNVDPVEQADRLGAVWVSLRADDDARSFDAIAQARAWGDHLGVLPVYLGDTSAGLWLAFKALAAPVGHHVLRQAACLAKLVEGELVVPIERNGTTSPWDAPGSYGVDNGEAVVLYRGERIAEPMRDDEWRRAHLDHLRGRYRV